MAFYSGDLQFQQQQALQSVAPVLRQAPAHEAATSAKATGINNKRPLQILEFGYQFAEVEKAISNFTKHQQFTHHYAPNVHLNRNHNHHHNHHHHNNRHNNHNNNNNHGNNNNNNNGGNNNGNGRFQAHGQSSFAMNAQLKQQQQQQFMLAHSTPQQVARFKQISNNVLSGQQQAPQQQQIQQQQHQHQQQPQQPQQPNFNQQFQQNFPQPINGYPEVPDLKYNTFQQHPQPPMMHNDMLANFRGTSPTLSAPIRPSSVSGFGAPLEQINSGSSSFGMSNSDLMSTPMTNPSSAGDYVEKKISLDDSSNAYLGDIWGNAKYTKSSTSVWA